MQKLIKCKVCGKKTGCIIVGNVIRPCFHCGESECVFDKVNPDNVSTNICQLCKAEQEDVNYPTWGKWLKGEVCTVIIVVSIAGLLMRTGAHLIA